MTIIRFSDAISGGVVFDELFDYDSHAVSVIKRGFNNSKQNEEMLGSSIRSRTGLSHIIPVEMLRTQA